MAWWRCLCCICLLFKSSSKTTVVKMYQQRDAMQQFIDQDFFGSGDFNDLNDSLSAREIKIIEQWRQEVLKYEHEKEQIIEFSLLPEQPIQPLPDKENIFIAPSNQLRRRNSMLEQASRF